MGCGSSKTLANSVSTRQQFVTSLRKKTRGYEEILVTKNGTDQQFITLLCTSNTLAKQLKEHESPKQSSLINSNASQTKSFDSTITAFEEPEDCEKNIETINTWELLAGLEDEEEVEEQRETGCLKRLNAVEQDDAKEMEEEGEGEKALRRKFSRTGSLRDWLMQSKGSNLTPKFGRFEDEGVGGNGERWEEDLIDPDLVAQLEKAMEDLTVDEEEVLRLIVEKWEGDVWC